MGCLPSAIDDEPVIHIFDLLKYWAEEPPTHVILALRYLGQRKKAQPRDAVYAQMQEMGAMLGQPVTAGKAPADFMDAVNWAEQMRSKVVKQTVNQS